MVFVPRKRLPHDVPSWIDPQREVYFLTINCQVKGTNQLANPETAETLFSAVSHHEEKGLWFAYCFLIMPDHVHGLFMFPPSGKTIERVVSDWKRWTSRHCGIDWQVGFFEHRLRHSESAMSKSDYILQNPVRAGLVAKPEDWPYFRRAKIPMNVSG